MHSEQTIVMILTNGYDPDMRVYKEAMHLVSHRHKVVILCWDREPEKHRLSCEISHGVEIIRFPFASIAGSGLKQINAFRKYAASCRSYLKRSNYDYLHCHDFDGMIVGLTSNQKKRPLVFDMHEYYEDVGPHKPIKRQITRHITKRMIKKSCCALYENDLYLQEKYASITSKLAPLKNYPSEALLSFGEKTESKVFRIGYHGAVRSQIPEFTTLFEAVNGMDDVRVDVHGGGPDLERLKAISSSYNNVHIHGPFNGVTELNSLYQNTDMVYAGYRPTSTTKECAEVVKFYECIITGTPLLLTESYTSMADKIMSCGFGLVCDTRSIESVRNAIIKLKDDSSFYHSCINNEREHSADYLWENAVEVLDLIYDGGQYGIHQS